MLMRRMRSRRIREPPHQPCFYYCLLHILLAVLLCGQLCLATKNFCGATWGDASEGCATKQPCASGLDEDCAPGTVCWGDTNCDTSKGDGLMYDLNHPSHMRFCGSSWEDASKNCEIKRHCPSGEDDECPKGQECYSFLSNCNFVDMMGGPEGAALASKPSGGNSKIGLDANDPARSNFCGTDWNDAIASCSKEDHWCRAGSDSECPGGKVCYAGTDCKYVADLHPTMSPTDLPTMSPMSPTATPVVYNMIDNTSFCGDNWEKVRSTCRIKSHCPDGGSCPPGFLCYSWVQGCNIIDFKEHLAETGKEIFGDGHWEMPEGGLPEDKAFDQPLGQDGPPKPPAEIESLIFGSSPPMAAPSPPGSSSAEITPSSQREPTTRAPVEPVDPNAYDAKNHIFCGKTWTDATERCSPDTFCSEGASHRCDDVSDYCWVGVTACNGAHYAATPAPVPQTVQPTTIAPTEHETDPKYAPKPVPTSPSTDIKPSSYSSGELIEGICARSQFQLIQTCKTLPACSNRNACADPYHECYSNVSCPGRPPPTPPASAVATRSPVTPAPVSPAPVTSAPTDRVVTANPTREPDMPSPTEPIFTSSAPTTPVTRRPTNKPTIFTLTEAEVALRYTNMNNYCARSYIEVMTSCSYQLTLCNDSPLCLEPGTTCFNNIICPDPLAFGDASPSSSPVQIPSPETKSPTIRPSHKPTEKPTAEPTLRPTAPKLASKQDSITVDQDSEMVSSPQNYCARPGQVQIDCVAGITCNDGEGPCSIGTFCFPAVICEAALEAPLPPPMPKGAKPSPPVATPNPTRTAPTHKPSGSAQNDESGNVEAISVCASTSQHAKDTCSIAPRCGSGTPCSANLYCFEVTCSASVTRENYCAHSADQIQGTCAWAPTCNPGDALCPQGMLCFPNSICLSKGQVLSEYDDPGVPSGSVAGTVLDDPDPGCTNLCLEELADCGYADDLTKMGFSFQQCTAKPSSGSFLAVGDLCIGDGLCGTRWNLNNCGSRDVYIRLDSSNCIEKGLGNSGVIQASPDVGSGEQSYATSSQSDTDVEQSNDGFGSSMKIDFSGADKKSEVNWDLGYSSTIDDDADPFQDGWWTMEVSSGTGTAHAHAGLVNTFLALSISVFAFDLIINDT